MKPPVLELEFFFCSCSLTKKKIPFTRTCGSCITGHVPDLFWMKPTVSSSTCYLVLHVECLLSASSGQRVLFNIHKAVFMLSSELIFVKECVRPLCTDNVRLIVLSAHNRHFSLLNLFSQMVVSRRNF